MKSQSSTIRIVNIPDYETRAEKIQEQLKARLIALRRKNLAKRDRKVPATALISDDDADFLHDDDALDLPRETAFDPFQDAGNLSHLDRVTLRERAEKLAKARIAASGIAHLRKEELERLRPALSHMKLIMCRDETQADEIAAGLHVEAPWLAAATEYAWHALRQSARRGEPIQFKPVILNGPPGVGKSVWSRNLAKALELPLADVDASKGGAGFGLVGVERGWGSAQPGRPLDLVLAQRVANPLVVVDEICKAKSATSESGSHHAFADSLLSLLEPATAQAWECPYFRVTFDMSHLSWILTSNTARTIPEPIRSRCQMIDIPDPTPQQLHDVADRQARQLGLTQASRDAALAALEQAPAVIRRRISLRDVSRILDRAVALEGRPMLQ